MTTPDPSTGERIRILRRKFQWTQAELAAKMKPPSTQDMISGVETGSRLPTIPWLRRAARALDVRLRKLIPREE